MEAISVPHAPSYSFADETPPPHLARFGMSVFLCSEALLFTGLMIGHIILRAGTSPWPPEGAPHVHIPLPPTSFMHWLMLINTGFLLTSSLTYHRAEVLMKRGRPGTFWYGLTFLLGAIFLGVQGYEWFHLRQEGMWFNTYGVYGTTFFTLTGFHGLHVLIGVVLVFGSLVRSVYFHLKKTVLRSAPASHGYEECVGLYWHFVDVVWMFLFSLLYFF